MAAAGSFGSAPPSAAPPRGPLQGSWSASYPPPFPKLSPCKFEFPSFATVLWCASFWNIPTTAEGEPWKILFTLSG